jgi:hypothetical protein
MTFASRRGKLDRGRNLRQGSHSRNETITRRVRH